MAKKWCKGNLPAWRARKMAQARDVLVLCWLGSFNRGKHAIGPSTRLAESARRPTRPSSSSTTTAATRALKSSPSLADCLSRPSQPTPHRSAMARTKVSRRLIFAITSSTSSLTMSSTANRPQVHRRWVSVSRLLRPGIVDDHSRLRYIRLPGKAPRKQLATKAARKTATAVRPYLASSARSPL